MQVVIDIPEKEYNTILNNNYVAICACPHLLSEAIKNGKPLPKDHGRLIDADALKKKVWDVDCRIGYVQVVDAGDIDNAEMIIEAGKEGNNA